MSTPEDLIGEEVRAAPTPCLVVHRRTVESNARTMRERAEALGVGLRPHIKTHKTVEGGRLSGGGESVRSARGGGGGWRRG